MRTVISIDLSPTGGYLATGSGDWQARVCKSMLIHLPFPSFTSGSGCLYERNRELLRCVTTRTLVYRRARCTVDKIVLYIIRAAVGARVCGLVSIWNVIFEYGKQTRETITGARRGSEGLAGLTGDVVGRLEMDSFGP